jgi:hypothetical protein
MKQSRPRGGVVPVTTTPTAQTMPAVERALDPDLRLRRALLPVDGARRPG